MHPRAMETLEGESLPEDFDAARPAFSDGVDRDRLESLLQIGFWELDIGQQAMHWSAGLRPMSTPSRRGFVECFQARSRPLLNENLLAVCETGESFDMEMRGAAGGLRKRWLRVRGWRDLDGGRRRIVGSVQDVTADVGKREELSRLAYVDAVTGLPNRSSFHNALEALLREREGAADFALLIVDLDDFKSINDDHGHAVGDQFLREIAARMTRVVRSSDIVARIGGDEFGIIAVGPRHEADIRDLSERLLEAARQNVVTSDGEIATTASIGISHAHGAGTSAAEAFGHADIAVHQVKSSGRNRAAICGSDMGRELEQRARVLEGVRRALREGQLVNYYQPIIDLKTRRLRGVEVLVRWRHPERGILPPAAFEAALADPVLSVAIDEHVLEQALDQMQAWMAAGVEVPAVCVNISAEQLRKPGIVDRVEEALRRRGLVPADLKFELLETAFFGRHTDQVAAAIAAFAQLGVVCALDDFGTGYASLTHLKTFRVERIKIDRSFVANICSDGFSRGLTRSIIDLGRNLGLRVTAEGVETEQQLQLLKEFGCDCVQGYLIARPFDAAQLPAFIADFHRD